MSFPIAPTSSQATWSRVSWNMSFPQASVCAIYSGRKFSLLIPPSFAPYLWSIATSLSEYRVNIRSGNALNSLFSCYILSRQGLPCSPSQNAACSQNSIHHSIGISELCQKVAGGGHFWPWECSLLEILSWNTIGQVVSLLKSMHYWLYKNYHDMWNTPILAGIMNWLLLCVPRLLYLGLHHSSYLIRLGFSCCSLTRPSIIPGFHLPRSGPETEWVLNKCLHA